jgi:hypothetical protein
MLMYGAAQIEETATQLAKRLEKLNFHATEHATLLIFASPRASCSITRVSDSFVS